MYTTPQAENQEVICNAPRHSRGSQTEGRI